MKLGLVILLATLALQNPAQAKTLDCVDFTAWVSKGTPSQKLKSFGTNYWKFLMETYPEWATYSGYPGQNGKLSDLSAEGLAQQKLAIRCQLKAIKQIPAAKLTEDDQVTLDLITRDLERSVEGQKFPSEYLVLNHLNGLHIDLPDLVFAAPNATKKDYKDIISRLGSVPAQAEQIEKLMREGLAKNITPVKMFMEKVPAQFDAILTPKIEDSPLYMPFKEIPRSVITATNAIGMSEEKQALQAEAKNVLETKTYPALKKLKQFIVTEYIPKARQNIAFSEMPDGKAWYAYSVKTHTTTDLTPDQLHELGLKEVERIQNEMNQIKDHVSFKGDLKAFNKYLMTDAKFYYKTPEQLMTGYREISKRIDPELPKLFGKLPRNTYGVREMPSYKAASAPTAYYQPGSLTTGRPGYFEANTYDLKARPIWGMEALTAHEAVPGHHLQISLGQEVEGLPDFRKNASYTAFVEGWGLYAESLGEELGLYKDPYSKYGQLSYEMWRAVRLVIDTGMHSKGWSREKALRYFMDMVPKTELEATVETDRYITWPGQALAYKVGEIKFKELKNRARNELGENFNVRSFHDEILRHGSIPMDVLEKQFGKWLKKQKASANLGLK
ncbi:MAG: DUF885 domain-containing protein [Bdellovibrionota bacterium]